MSLNATCLVSKATAFLLFAALCCLPPTTRAQGATNGGALVQVNSDGTCAVRSGDGNFLAQIERITQGECLQRCAKLGAGSCQWRGQHLQNAPQALCRVRGGAHRTLTPDFVATQADCQAECNRFAANAYRYCDWGNERVQLPPSGSECRVRGGAGRELLAPPIYGTLADCQGYCDQYAANGYRSCQYGNTMLREQSAAYRCEILGGAAKPLVTPFYGSRADCQASCDLQSANEFRSCYYGGSAIVEPKSDMRCEIRVSDGAWADGGARKVWALHALLYGAQQACDARCAGVGVEHPIRSCKYGNNAPVFYPVVP